MLKYFNNDNKTLFVMFRMNEFGNDTLRIGITPRDEKGDQIKDQSCSFYVFRDMNWKTSIDGRINYRDLDNFICGVEHILEVYEKGNPSGEKLEFSDSYCNVKTDHVISFSFALIEINGKPKFILNIADKSRECDLTQTYQFRGAYELARFISYLKMFLDEEVNFIIHMVVAEMKEILKKEEISS